MKQLLKRKQEIKDLLANNPALLVYHNLLVELSQIQDKIDNYENIT